MNRRLVLETCCEEINVKYFVKLQFCLEEVREIERTRLKEDCELAEVEGAARSVHLGRGDGRLPV